MVIPFPTAVALMAAMAVKHFVADFLFQTSSIARGKAARENWLVPLLLHAGGHAAITLVIALAFFPRAWWVAGVELVIHALIDRGKVMVGDNAHLDPKMSRFWWLFGFDQLLHNLTDVAIIGVFLSTTAVA